MDLTTELGSSKVDPYRNHRTVMEPAEATMAVTLSIKNVPEALAERLRQRAAKAERSLQGELLVILREAVEGRKRLTAVEALRRLRMSGLSTEAESVALVRADRDGR